MTGDEGRTSADVEPTGALGLIDRAARYLGALFVASFTTIVVYVAFSSYALSTTPRWAEELPRLLLVWLTFVGTISAFAQRSHFSAGLLQLVIPPGRARREVTTLATLSSAVLLVVLAVTGWKIAGLTWSNRTTAMSMPMGLFYAAPPATCGFSLAALLLVARRRRTPNSFSCWEVSRSSWPSTRASPWPLVWPLSPISRSSISRPSW